MNYSITSAAELCDGGMVMAFAVFNLRGERVYRIARKVDAAKVTSGALTPMAAEVYAAAEALAYFSHFIRHRYYDEHFATILDEDYVRLRARIALDTPDVYAPTDPLYALCDRLTEFRTRPTITFGVENGTKDMDETVALMKEKI